MFRYVFYNIFIECRKKLTYKIYKLTDKSISREIAIS